MSIRRRTIEAKVEKLLEVNNITKAPVPVPQIAKSCGLRIVVDSLEGDLSGFLYRDKDRAVVGVNTQHASTRQNFTLAHELGHFILHDQERLHVDHEFHVRLRSDLSSQGIDEDEREANWFAAALLMPKQFIAKDLEAQGSIDLFDDSFLYNLARKYEVSTQALVNRFKNLGYIQE